MESFDVGNICSASQISLDLPTFRVKLQNTIDTFPLSQGHKCGDTLEIRIINSTDSTKRRRLCYVKWEIRL